MPFYLSSSNNTHSLCKLYYPFPTLSLLSKCQTLWEASVPVINSCASHLRVRTYGSILKDRGAGPSYWAGPPPDYLLNASFGSEAPASPLRFDDLCFGVEPLCEALVLTAVPSRAHLRVTLVLWHSVQTLRLQATRVLISRLAVTAGNLRQVSHLDWHLAYHFVSLGTEAQWKERRWASVSSWSDNIKALWQDPAEALQRNFSRINQEWELCLFTTQKCWIWC